MHAIAESFTEVETVDDYLDWGSDNLVDVVYQQEKDELGSFSEDGIAEVEEYFARGVDVGRPFRTRPERELGGLAEEAPHRRRGGRPRLGHSGIVHHPAQ